MAVVINDGTKPRICKKFHFFRFGKLIEIVVKIKNPTVSGSNTLFIGN